MSLYDPGSDPDLGLPALRAFMTWALPGLDSGSREGLLRSAAASGEAAYLDNGIAPPRGSRSFSPAIRQSVVGIGDDSFT